MPVLWAMLTATGMKIATTAVELMTLLRIAEATMSRNRVLPSLVAGDVGDPLADLGGDPGAGEGLADNEEARNGEHHRVGEPGERLQRTENPAQTEREHDQKGRDVHPDTSARHGDPGDRDERKHESTFPSPPEITSEYPSISVE